MGKKGDKNENSALVRTQAFSNDKTKPKPIPLERCPWCGAELSNRAFQLLPNADYPTELKVEPVVKLRVCDPGGMEVTGERYFSYSF